MRSTLTVAGAALFLTSVYRAATYPFTHDEALTYAGFTWQPVWKLTTNLHPLMTWTMQVVSALFGNGPFVLRLPTLFAHALYLSVTILVLQRFESRAVHVAGFVLLAMNPFVLDFFFVARGYGLALAFELLAVLLLLRGRPYLAVASAALATLALIILLNFFLPVLAIAAWQKRDKRREVMLLLGIAGAFVLSVALHGIHLRILGAFFWGGRSFLFDSLPTLVASLLYGVPFPPMPIVWAIVIGFVWIVFKRRDVVLCLLAAAIALPLTQFWLLGTPLPIERAALFYVPLYVLALLAATPRAAIVVAAIVLAHFAATFDPRTCLEWPYEKHNVEVLERIDADRHGCNVRMGNMWMVEPSMNFYRVTRGYTWLAPLTRASVRGDEDYVYTRAFEVRGLRGKVLAVYPDTNTILVRVPGASAPGTQHSAPVSTGVPPARIRAPSRSSADPRLRGPGAPES